MGLKTNPNLLQQARIMAGFAAVMIVAMLVYQVWESYASTVDGAKRDILQLAEILGASTDATFQSVEIIIDHAVEEVHDKRQSVETVEDVAQRLAAVADNWSFIYSVAFAGPDGVARALATRDPDGHLHVGAATPDLSKSVVFQVHKTAGPDGANLMFISKPVTAAVSGSPVLAISKSVRAADGTFQGICVVTVSLDTVAHLFAGILPTKYRAAGMFRADSSLLFSTQPGAKLGAALPESYLFKTMVPATPAATYRVKGASDGIERLVAYEVSAKYPIVVAVNAVWRQVLAHWRTNTLVLVGSAVLGLTLIGALTSWLTRQIAAEQLAQQALIKSERSLIESQRLGGIAHFERNLRSNEQIWGDNMYAIHGVDPAVFKPSRLTFLELVVPADREKVRRSWGNSDEPVVAGTLECRIALPGGGIRHVHYNWRQVYDGGMGPTRVFGVAQDVTAIRTAESTIQDDEQRLRDIVECSSDYIWEADADGRVTFFSGAGAAKFGRLIGQRLRILSDELYDKGDAGEMREAVDAQRAFRNLVVPLGDLAGEQHWIRSSANPRFDSQGSFLGYRGVGTDVTETLRQQERDEDNRRAEALGRLASGLAHEINNLLQPIMIYASFGTARPEIQEDVRQYFSRIARAAERASLIVKNVLAFARRSQPNREIVNPLEVVRETVDFISGTLAPGTVIAVDEAAGDVMVTVDRTGLAQVLTNLFSNAAEALTDGGRVRVSLATVSLSGDTAKALALLPGLYCRLGVEDDGPGIPPEHIGKVFDPFFTTKPQGKGTGLGLSVVSGLVKSWGGSVGVDSVFGERTCFSIYLPLVDRQMQAAQ